MGRPSKLTPSLQNAICRDLELAIPVKHAAQANGISEDTYHEWIARGQRDEKPSDKPYVEFFRATTRAQSVAVRKLARKALTGGKGCQQATWMLERRHRRDYGPVNRFEHTGAEGAPISIQVEDIGKLSDDELRDIANRE